LPIRRWCRVSAFLLTSHLVESRLRVTIDPTLDSGLPNTSQVMIEKVMSLPRDQLDSRIGNVTADQL